ncbi:hypothetical protein [Salinibaculum salinum]|uniref:hypothetical protein n=1 Tax=Salinibaculum salinum TaxID=3131996 RepID=UPI0030EB38F2
MRTKLIALALTAMLTIGAGGVVAAGASPATDETHDDQTEHEQTDEVGNYEFVVSDEDQWLTDRQESTESIPKLVMNDADASEQVRQVFAEDERLQMELYGSLGEGDDSAHVRITAVDPESSVDPLLVEVTVDLENETVTVVGSDDERTTADETVTVEQSVTMDDLNVTDSDIAEGTDQILTTSHVEPDGYVETLSAESFIEIPLSNSSAVVEN